MIEKKSTKWLVRIGVLIAIIVLMSFTPVGYLKVGTVEITFLMIPVIIGAITLGAKSGAILGAVFGITSFIQCFGMSSFGIILLSINPVFTQELYLRLYTKKTIQKVMHYRLLYQVLLHPF